MKTYAIYDQCGGEPLFYVEAKDIDNLIETMRKRNENGEPDGIFPGWSPVEVNKESLNTTEKTLQHKAPVINLADYTHYREKLSEIINSVNELSETIYESLFPLACLNKWKQWDRQQPEGTEIYVSDEMLRNTGDKNIDFLWELLDKIAEMKEKIRV